jgi:hypothetical protein
VMFVGRDLERWPVDADRDTMNFEEIQDATHHGFGLEQMVPLGVIEVGSKDDGSAAVAFHHQLEEGVGLLGFEGEICQLIDQKDGITRELSYELWGRIGQLRSHNRNHLRDPGRYRSGPGSLRGGLDVTQRWRGLTFQCLGYR